MPLVVASASLASTVIPIAVPRAAFSSTASAAASLSLIGVMSNSSKSFTAIVKSCVAKLASAEVARTVML